MCTVTLISHQDGYRLACNRDELRTRPPAEPPRVLTLATARAIAPIDPAGGGTWIGVNEHGLTATLLNLNPPDPPPLAPKSRGELVMRALGAGGAADAGDLVGRIEPRDYRPFRLVVVSLDGEAVVVRSDGVRVDVESIARHTMPFFITSSGLGDHLVEAPRRSLFERSFEASAGGQDAFHAHRWGDRPELSVNMDRADAATVSYTVVESSSSGILLRYLPGSPTGECDQTTLHLEARGASA